MLTAAEFTEFDLSALSARLLTASLRQDRCRRQAAAFREHVPAARIPGLDDAVVMIDDEAETLAEASRCIDALRRCLADAVERRPATVLQLVPRPEPDPVRPAPRLGPFDRLRAALGRPAARAQVA